MKKALTMISVIALSALITGCGGEQATKQETVKDTVVSETVESAMEKESATESEVQTAYDQTFLSNFSDALQARWDLSNIEVEYKSFQEETEHLKDIVDAEKSILDDCRNQKFDDPLLQEYAITYINGVDQQERLIEEAMKGEVEEEEFRSEWSKSYIKRYQQICAIYDNYDLRIDSKYNYNINTIHNYVYVKEYGDERFWDMLNDHWWDNYEEIEEADGKVLMKIRRVNQTDYEFKDFSVFAVLYDTKGTDDSSDDEEIETIEFVIGDWKPGEEVILQFKRTTETRENEVLDLYSGY